MSKPTVWHGCYEGGWHGGLITPESFSHPAKFSRGLIRRIYQHLRDHYGLPAGAVVVDPFGGVALGALDAMACGYTWVGVELERRFWWLGAGGDCPGFTREQWRQFYARGPRFFDVWGLCPDCQKAWQPDGYDCRQDYGMFHKREIPHREPHHFMGNLDLFRKGRPGAQAVLLQGDSRELRRHVGAAGVIVGSPPFSETLSGHDKQFEQERASQPGSSRYGRKSHTLVGDYGTTPGQLGSMKPGSLDAVVSSPPYAESIGNENQIDYSKAKGKHDGLKPSTARDALGGPYGTTEGNLGNLKAGSVEAVVGSPPYAESPVNDAQRTSAASGGYIKGVRSKGSETDGKNYGASAGNLGNLPAGSVEAACDAVDAVISSPPWAGMDADKKTTPGFEHIGTCKDEVGYAPSRVSTRNQFAYMSPEWLEERKRTAKLNQNIGNLPTEAKDPDYPTFWSAARQIISECHAILKPGGLAVWVLKSFVRASKIVDFPGDWKRLCESCGFETVEEVHASLVKVDEHPGLFGEPVVKEKKRCSFFRRNHEIRAASLKWLGEQPAEIQKALVDAATLEHFKAKPRRIREIAAKAGWEAAGKPFVEIETRIDFEVVLFMRKPAGKEALR